MVVEDVPIIIASEDESFSAQPSIEEEFSAEPSHHVRDSELAGRIEVEQLSIQEHEDHDTAFRLAQDPAFEVVEPRLEMQRVPVQRQLEVNHNYALRAVKQV